MQNQRLDILFEFLYRRSNENHSKHIIKTERNAFVVDKWEDAKCFNNSIISEYLLK